MRLFSIILLFLPFSFYGQTTNVKLKEETINNTIKYMKIINFSPLYRDFDYEPRIVDSLTRVNNAPLSFDFNLSEAGFLSIIVLNKTQTVFITPGDNVNFKIITNGNSAKFLFTGTNSWHYNYFQILADSVKKLNFNLKFNLSDGFSPYKINVEKYISFKNSFLLNYCQEFPVSTSFRKFAQQEIDFEYIHLLYSPLIRDFYTRNTLLPQDYFINEKIIINKYINAEISYTSNAMLAFVYKYILSYPGNYLLSFDKILTSINKDFKNQNLSFMQTNLIGVYAKVQKDNYKESLLKLIALQKKNLKDTVKLNYIKNREVEYTKLNRKMPDDVLDETFLIKYGTDKIITLRELMKSFEGKALYFDFWASWCGPCKEDILESKNAKVLFKSKEVELIYLSMDTEKTKGEWLKNVESNNIQENQYYLINNFKSKLAAYFNVLSIPRYSYFDKAFLLRSIDAPRINQNNYTVLRNFILSN